MALTAATIFRDNEFPPDHLGIHYNADECFVDVMDCLLFVCASDGAARGMKKKLFNKEPTWDVVWADSIVKRKRSVCKTSSMLKALGLCTKAEAAMLASKLSKLAAIVVSKDEIAKYAMAPVIHKADEFVDTSDMTKVNSTTTAIAAPPVSCPFFPVENMQGLLYCCTVALGNDEAKKVMQTVANMQTTEAMERNVYARKERDAEFQHKQRKRKAESLVFKIKELKSMGYDQEAATVLNEYMAL